VGNLLIDGGFELPALAAGTYVAAPGTGLWIPSGSPWSFVADLTDQAGISTNGSAISGFASNAPQGAQAAFITNTGFLFQNFTLADDWNAPISFFTASAGTPPTGFSALLEVDLDISGPWTPHAFTFDMAVPHDWQPHSTPTVLLPAGTHRIVISAPAVPGLMILLDHIGPLAWVRLRHSSGQGYWQSRGDVTEEWAGGAKCIKLPFDTLSTPPTTVLGRDVTTGLPMWSALIQPPPPPPPVDSTFTTPDDTGTGTPTPLPPPLDSERICGAAEQMAKQLVDIANIAVMTINSAKNSILTLWGNILKKQVADDIGAALLAAEAASIFVTLVPFLLGLAVLGATAVIATASNLPTIEEPNPLVPMGNSIFHIIHCQAYCSLQASHGNYLTAADDPTGVGTRQRWRDALVADWSFFQGSTIPGVNGTDNLPWQLGILVSILDHTTDSLWQLEASDGAHLACTFCTDCGCG
jgi:hypothetical protein